MRKTLRVAFPLCVGLLLVAACHGSSKPGTGGASSAGTGASSGSLASGSTGGAQATGTTGPSTTTSSATGTSNTSTTSASSSTGGGMMGLHVVGNKLVDGGNTVRLFGVDRSGAEFACIQGNGFFDGPADQADIDAMKSWHANAVRVPLNEDCWLAINGAPAQYSGTAYQDAISQWVHLLRQNGLYVILDLHWNNGGAGQATGQQQMADADHAPAFWTGVASAFKSDLGVVFDLYNEPHDISWACWRDGGCQINGWTAAGMNQLISAVRGTGAQNVVMAGGIAWSGDLSQWLQYKPTDPTGNLAASFHTYNFSNCSTAACRTSQVEPVAAQVPIITGEVGENDCAHGFVDGYMQWADTLGISYLGWTWNTWNCSQGPALISDYTGTPTAFGAGIKAHLLLVNP